MLRQVPTHSMPALLPLATKLKDQRMAQAVLAGTRPGIALTDSMKSPTCLFILAQEGAFAWTYLAGNAHVPKYHQALNRWLFESYGPKHGIAFTFLVCDGPEWQCSLPAILSPRAVVPDRRLYYECTAPPQAGWRDLVPTGYEIRELDRTLLQSDIAMHEKVSQWMAHNFGSQEKFLERAFGAVAVHDEHVVAWCLPDSVGLSRADIGVETEAEHQRRGLAHACTCLFLEMAFAEGLSAIGWHCHVINVPSNRTAVKAGFALMYEYPAYALQFDPEKQEELAQVIGVEFAEQALAMLDNQDYAGAHTLYRRLSGFHSSQDPSVLVNAARAAAGCGHVEEAFQRLAEARQICSAIDAALLAAPEFAPLREDVRWEKTQKRSD